MLLRPPWLPRLVLQTSKIRVLDTAGAVNLVLIHYLFQTAYLAFLSLAQLVQDL